VGAIAELDEPVALDGGLARDGVVCLGHLLIDAAQGAAGPVVAVLVVDDLVTPAGSGPGGPGLGEDVPVRDVLARVLAPPLRHHVGDLGDAQAEDERQPGRFDLLLVGLRHHPRVRHDRDVGQLVGGHERLDHRQHGLGLSLVALEGADHQREPGGVGEQADGDLRVQAALLGVMPTSA